MTSPYLDKPLRSEEQARTDRAQVRRQLKESVELIRRAISGRCFIDEDEDFLTLADSLFDACCAMKAEERQAEEWENTTVERMNYEMRKP